MKNILIAIIWALALLVSFIAVTTLLGAKMADDEIVGCFIGLMILALLIVGRDKR